MLPRPGVLSNQSRPPSSPASRAEMARPRPVPPCRRVILPSTCTKGAKSAPDTGIVELVVFEDADSASSPPQRPRHGFFLLSLQREVDETLTTLAALGFADGVRRISVPAPGGKTVPMAVITAPDGVLVELIGSPQ